MTMQIIFQHWGKKNKYCIITMDIGVWLEQDYFLSQ